MKNKKEYALEDILKDATKLLDNIGDVDGFIKDLPTETAEAYHTNIRKKSLESIEEDLDLKTNGYAEISVSDDEMQASAYFFPPSQGMMPLKIDDLAEILRNHDIVKGVDWEAISDAVYKCNTELEPVIDVVIARGLSAVDEIPEHLEILETLRRKTETIAQRSERVDFKQVTPFLLVRKGNVLADIVPKRQGKEGYTVTGKALPFRNVKIKKLSPGKNTILRENTVVSGCDGRFKYTAQGFWVTEVLEILNDVDYGTGNIDFPGDVIIRGEILDGFKVKAGGALYCSKTMDASDVECAKEVIVQQGIIGKKQGMLKTEGRVQAKFIENCYVQAKGPITIHVGIINSSIHTLDRVELGFRGMITGGKIYAQNGVTAAQLGSKSWTRTEIYCGIDYSVEQKLEWIRDRNIQLAEKLNSVRDEIKRNAENKTLVELRDKLQDAIRKMNEAAGNLVQHLDRNEDAAVSVRGNVFPGVYIEICHISYVVNRKLSGVTFSLDKSKGQVVYKLIVPAI